MLSDCNIRGSSHHNHRKPSLGFKSNIIGEWRPVWMNFAVHADNMTLWEADRTCFWSIH